MTSRSSPAFLVGGGEMGTRIRALDPSILGLGPAREWPAQLKSALSIALSSSFPTCVYWGPELRLLYNDAWAMVPGDRHPGCLGQPAREVWADIWPIVGPQFQQVVDTRRGFAAYDHHLPLIREGEVRETYWTYSFTPLFDDVDQVAGVLNQAHETTTTVLGERARTDEIARLRAMFEQAPGAIALLDGPTHVFALANLAYSELVGRPVIGRTVAEALPEIVEQGFVELLDQVYATGTTYRGEGIKVGLRRSADGELERRVVDFLYQPLFDAARRVTGIFVQATDVTERDHALRQLVEADRRKDVFLATLAHELRNPLAPIRTGLQLLKLAGGGDDRLRHTRDMMERQMRHLVHLVDDLMDLSRIATGKIHLRLEELALHEVLARAIESTSAVLEQKGQTLDLSIADTTLRVDGDGERLVQVFANLLNNAVKFTPEQEHIRLALKRVGEWAEVRVEDDGIGIPPESLAHVFEMFAQIEKPAGTVQGGLGIGLALVAQLVQLHGGHVAASSEGTGRGTAVTVRLPLTLQDTPASLGP